jgi:hypothetical protein
VLFTALGVVLLRSAEDPVPLGPTGLSLRLVPDDALVTVELVADQTRPQVDDALQRLDQVPGGTALLGRLREDLIPDACPRLSVSSREVTVALLRTGADGATGPVEPLVLIERGGTRTDAGPVRRCGGRTAQRLGRFVAIGPAALVRRARRLFGVPEARGSLAALVLRRTLTTGLPRDRVLTAWLTPDGVRDALPARGRAATMLAALLDRPGLRGVALGVESTDDGAHVVVRSDGATDPNRPFAATAPVQAPAAAAGTLLTTDPQTATLQALDALSASRGQGPDELATLILELAGRIDAATGGAVRRDVSDATRSPSEVVLGPDPAVQGTGTGGRLATTVVVPVTDGRRAAAALGRLRPRLARALGDPPVTQARLAGHRSWSIRLPDGGGAGYLVDGDQVVVYTSRAAAEAVLAPGPRLTDRVRWSRGRGESRNVAMSIGFLDFPLSLRAAAPSVAGLSSTDRAVLDGLRRVRTVQMRSRAEGGESTFDVDLRIP